MTKNQQPRAGGKFCKVPDGYVSQKEHEFICAKGHLRGVERGIAEGYADGHEEGRFSGILIGFLCGLGVTYAIVLVII